MVNLKFNKVLHIIRGVELIRIGKILSDYKILLVKEKEISLEDLL